MPEPATLGVSSRSRHRRIGSVLLLVMAFFLTAVVLSACGGSASDHSASSATVAPQPSSYVTLDVKETHRQLSQNDQAQMVDVREPREWATTGVPVGAVLIPLGQLEQRAPAELAKDWPVYVICNSGNRSRTGAEILLKLGYTAVYNVDGGIQALAAGRAAGGELHALNAAHTPDHRDARHRGKPMRFFFA